MSSLTESLVSSWDAEDVNVWLSSIGYKQYRNHFIEHGISGDVLVQLDHEALKDVGVTSMGQRLAILKAVYHLKIDNHIPIEADDYIPPSEAVENSASDQANTIDSIIGMLHEQSDRIRALEEENQKLHHGLLSLEEIVSPNAPTNGLSSNSSLVSLKKQPSFKWASYGKSVKSPTRPLPEDTTGYNLHQDSPRISPQTLEHDGTNQVPNTAQTLKMPEHQLDIGTAPSTATTLSSSSAPYSLATPTQPHNPSDRSNASRSRDASGSEPKPRAGASTTPGPSGDDRAENQFKSFKVSLDDPYWKVLPAALKKYKINDDWRQYAMFICYGNTERCLSYDEKPLLLFQKLKDANKNPVFMLRHIKDIRSPIAVAQQKQADRQSQTSPPPYSQPPQPKKMDSSRTQGNPLASPAANLYTRNTRLHQTPQESLQPVNAKIHNLNANGSASGTPPITAQNGLPWPESSTGQNGDDVGGRSRIAAEDNAGQQAGRDPLGPAGHADAVILSTGISYAIAIYPYMAEQEDEFDVVVGATFVIHSRAKGWWVVQRDSDGFGEVDENAKQGWVPAGCLLETSMAPATAVAEVASHQRAVSMGSSIAPPAYSSGVPSGDAPPPGQGGSSSLPVSRAPILPSSIISTSFPGVALMDYAPKGDHELDLIKDDLLRVFKRYNHWSYAVKEDSGCRGWVPSWLIGKVSTGPVPPTPSTIAGHMPSQGSESRYDNDDPPLVPSKGPGFGLSNGYSQSNGSSSSTAVQPSPLSPGFSNGHR